MIELIASGPIEQIEDTKISRDDGHDSIYGRVSIIDRSTIEIDLEFEQGHVNLEGYAPSASSWSVSECIGRFIREGIDDNLAQFELIDNDWTVELRGEIYDWIQQAHRYVTERPDMSIHSALGYFKTWDETKSSTIESARGIVERRVEHGTKNVGELSNTEWVELEESLNGLTNVSIPESYSDEQTNGVIAQ